MHEASILLYTKVVAIQKTQNCNVKITRLRAAPAAWLQLFLVNATTRAVTEAFCFNNIRLNVNGLSIPAIPHIAINW